MHVSWSWLAEFVDLDGLTPEQVADTLTMSGMEVEDVRVVGGELDAIVVGHVLTCVPHEDSDHLSVCTVDAGDGGDPLQIVCGAPNVAAGVRVPLAPVGTTMPAGFAIKKAKIRGVKSFGMLCSAEELGLSSDADGLLLLDGEPEAGTRITELLGTRDTVLELGLTPNRPDGLSIRGVAREVAALFGRATRDDALHAGTGSGETVGDINDLVAVEIADADGCPRYACAAIRGVQVGPSPDWLRSRIEAIGQRSVNNIVDVTNYVLFEQGQPLHAFDLERVRGARVVVRRAAAGESIESIDHVDRVLETSDLVIADGDGPIAIAGVMGGAESEVSDATTAILIECANFEPSTVRRSARRLDMHTQASHRFERGVDVERVPQVLTRAIELMLATQDEGAEVVGGVIDVYPKRYVAPVIKLPADLPGKVLGMDVSADDIRRTLTSLGLDVRGAAPVFEVAIPAYRPDLERPIDLVEEVGRLVGYDAIPSTPLTGPLGIAPTRRSDAPRAQERQPILTQREVDAYDRLRTALVGEGAFEAVNWAMIDPARATAFADDGAGIRLQNPLGEERSEMRRTLLVGLLDNVAHNLSHGAESVRLFEIGRVYPRAAEHEPTYLSGVLCGTTGTHWSAPARAFDGHDAVGVVERALRAAGVGVDVVAADPPTWAHPAASASLSIGGRVCGWVGRLHPDVVTQAGVEEAVFGFEVEIGAALAEAPPVASHATIAKTPASARDAAFVVDASLPYGELRDALTGFRHKLLESIELFDVFSGGSLEPGKKSIAVRATYRDPSATLTDAQVDKVHAKLVRHAERLTGATIRT